MEYFRKIRDYVLGEDLSSDPDSPHTGRPSKRAAGQHQDTWQQADKQATAQRQPPTRQGASSGGEAVASTAALPRGPGVLRDVTDGASGGVQGLGWYKAKLKQDADGDVAEQFWSEVPGQSTAGGSMKGQPNRPLQVQRKQLKRAQTGGMRIQEGNVDVEIHGQQ